MAVYTRVGMLGQELVAEAEHSVAEAKGAVLVISVVNASILG